jgi:uncharacterized protein
VIASNLALLTGEMLDFCKAHDVSISTSLDGPADLHNKNRPRAGGKSHELAVHGIKRAQQVLGVDRVSALMTTTEASLNRVEQIVDEYLSLGLDGIFLRPLSPYRFAVKTKQFERYNATRWFDFYRRGLRYILDINQRGQLFSEFYASLILKRMLSDRPIGYVDLRSPAGIGLGALVYNYDGTVFASDEGRMLAEMGDRTFELGHVSTASYRSLVLSEKLIDLVAASLTQCVLNAAIAYLNRTVALNQFTIMRRNAIQLVSNPSRNFALVKSRSWNCSSHCSNSRLPMRQSYAVGEACNACTPR